MLGRWNALLPGPFLTPGEEGSQLSAQLQEVLALFWCEAHDGHVLRKGRSPGAGITCFISAPLRA
jgi:hypothetical protein